MRDDLHRMEQADRYLDGAMSAAERSEFEATAAANSELRQVIDEQRALREGMQRLHLRGALSAAHTGWVLKQWLPKIITLLVVGGLVAGGAWYWKAHPHLFEFEKDEPYAPVVVDTLKEEVRPGPIPPRVHVIRRDSTVDTVIYLIKDGKRIRVDSIPKGARVIGTEIHKKSTSDSTQLFNEVPASSQPEAVADVLPATRSTEAAGPGVNYLSISAPPDKDGSAKEMHILRPENSEAQPMYPGGFDAMYLFLKKNLRVPDDLKITGTVVVSFVVDEKGAIKEPVIEQGLSKSCDAEALRVVKSMPKWIPCKAEGKPVRSRIEVPLTFSPGKVKSGSSEEGPEVRPMKIPRQLRNGGG